MDIELAHLWYNSFKIYLFHKPNQTYFKLSHSHVLSFLDPGSKIIDLASLFFCDPLIQWGSGWSTFPWILMCGLDIKFYHYLPTYFADAISSCCPIYHSNTQCDSCFAWWSGWISSANSCILFANGESQFQYYTSPLLPQLLPLHAYMI